MRSPCTLPITITRKSGDEARIKLMRREPSSELCARADLWMTSGHCGPGLRQAAFLYLPISRKMPEDHPRSVTLPHLGALQGRGRGKLCRMLAEQPAPDFLENGIFAKLQLPEAVMPRCPIHELRFANRNVPNMVGQTLPALQARLNIADL